MLLPVPLPPLLPSSGTLTTALMVKLLCANVGIVHQINSNIISNASNEEFVRFMFIGIRIKL